MAAHLDFPPDHPHVAVVTLDRPQQANSLDPPTLRELADCWRRIASDPDVRCAVLTGAGARVFCGGMDMKTTIPAAQRLARGERLDTDTFEGLRSVSTALLAGFDLQTPLICAVNGHARAGGFDLMLAAELRFAVPHATFALEEVALGLYPTGNATVLLPRQIPWVHAYELLLTARPVNSWRQRSLPRTRSPRTPRWRCAKPAAACVKSYIYPSQRPTSGRKRSAARCAAPRTRAKHSGRSSKNGDRCGRGDERDSDLSGAERGRIVPRRGRCGMHVSITWCVP
jgi:hypothetical protein